MTGPYNWEAPPPEPSLYTMGHRADGVAFIYVTLPEHMWLRNSGYPETVRARMRRRLAVYLSDNSLLPKGQVHEVAPVSVGGGELSVESTVWYGGTPADTAAELAAMRAQYPYATTTDHMLVDGKVRLRCRRCTTAPVPEGFFFISLCGPCLDTVVKEDRDARPADS